VTDRHAHCGYCGAAFGEGAAWPRACTACGQVSYRNPLPVAVLLVPVGEGLLLVKRGIEPGLGQWAFPGGYINYGERWKHAAERELFEETGLHVRAGAIREYRVLTSPDGAVLLVFGLAPALAESKLRAFEPNDEVTEIDVATKPQRLAFATHSQVMRDYFR
jgi:ADP-ribose pyrophosphatase YjhB (NUDIX family)